MQIKDCKENTIGLLFQEMRVSSHSGRECFIQNELR